MNGDQLCEKCSAKATEANTWTNPATDEEYDLRDLYLPLGQRYEPDGWVWKHLGGFWDDVPIIVPVQQPGMKPGEYAGRLITELAFEVAGSVAWRQQMADRAAH
ncbi:hypothetical protein [Streptomyces sp. NBC_00687]|uniref:hypothetical protein n=1 Tax=Streptomyces sp. NBC_00687 TaxID=2975807 RepID=UPI00225A9C61|nr:hypothetical protein [Streptomyces sp. NBC_00687]MCX4912859.1 hypothetical protein [Streptomyces sp. NBC_00687]